MRLERAFYIALLGFTLAIVALSEEPGPPPRVVDPPNRLRIYTVQVFTNGKPVGEAGVDRAHELDELLYTLAIRHCTSPRQYELTPEGWTDTKRPIARPRIEVAIWDSQRERWHHPAGKAMPSDWSGLLPLTLTVNVGSYRIE